MFPGLLRLSSILPEEKIQNEDHLRPLRLRRSLAFGKKLNSGQRLLVGVELFMRILASG
jgi:hypothetical protein